MSPWQKLKKQEEEILDLLVQNKQPSEQQVEKLRDLLDECSRDEAPFRSICFRGSLACLAEVDGDIELAIKHRKTEIALFDALYTSKDGEPEEYTVPGYLIEDRRKREYILERLICIR